MTMGCTPSSQSSDQTGMAYGTSANNLPAPNQQHCDSGSPNRRPSIEMNGSHKDMREPLVSHPFLFYCNCILVNNSTNN